MFAYPPHAACPDPTQRLAAVIRLSALGDVALTTGVLLHVFKCTGTRFIYITKAAHTPLLTGNPAIAEIRSVDESRLHGMAWAEQAAEIAHDLAVLHPGLTLYDLHGTLRARVLAALWPGRVIRSPKFSVARRLFLFTRLASLCRFLERLCVTQRYALTFGLTDPPTPDLLPCIFLSPAETADGRARVRSALNLTSDAPLPRPVALHPYATHLDKAWPREHWIELTRLLDKQNAPWLILGRNTDPLFPDDPRDLTNTTDLRATCSVLAACAALATNDSGPMHLATAVGTPVTALFGPTTRAWGFAPQGPYDAILELPLPCRPCTLHGKHRCPRGHACLRDITPQAVLETLLAQKTKKDRPLACP